MKSFLKWNWPSLVIIALAVAWGYWRTSLLIHDLPTDEEINRAFENLSRDHFLMTVLPPLNLFLVFVLATLPRYSPLTRSYLKSSKQIAVLNFVMTLILMGIYLVIL